MYAECAFPAHYNILTVNKTEILKFTFSVNNSFNIYVFLEDLTQQIIDFISYNVIIIMKFISYQGGFRFLNVLMHLEISMLKFITLA